MAEPERKRPQVRRKSEQEIYSETAWDRTVRKFSAEPLVPIGAVVTCIVLSFGLRTVMRKDAVKSQFWMRARVLAQGFTLSAMVFGSAYNLSPPLPKDASEYARQKMKEEE